MQIPGLQFLSKTTWENIWELWREREGARADWQQVAKQKGWDSWEQWRLNWVKNFDAQNREWARYRILHPLKTVPHFRIGPTQSWQQNFPATERNQHTFAELIAKKDYRDNTKIRDMLANFPSPTEFIGLVMPDRSITLIEGHHRATTISIAAQTSKEINLQPTPTIALTEFQEDELKLLDIMLAKGSKKSNPTHMQKFLVLYMASEATRQAWANMSKEEGQKGMEEWRKWMERRKESLADPGNPAGKNHRVTKDGASEQSNDICGYSVIQAESAEAAAELLADNPHLFVEGTYMELMPLTEM